MCRCAKAINVTENIYAMKSERITCDNYISFMTIIASQLDSFMFERKLLHASLSYAFPSKFMRPGVDYRPFDVKVTASNSISKYCVSKYQLEIATCWSSKCSLKLIKGPFWESSCCTTAQLMFVIKFNYIRH